MSRIPELDRIRPDLEKFVTSTAEHIGESAICVNIFTENYARSIDSLLQFSIAIMLDKPIYLLAANGTKIPEHVKRIASHIEFCEMGNSASMRQATERLMAIARQRGFAA